ncbi:hypothetical protein IAR55_001181 [Kwoniella newhampshirensis]|uniref:Uncharacterized protein n=1 Tax=Kwoniella newhampshirensis TaxID=1651941 RepID=A0AAW0Z511_9TREE
MSLRDTSCYTLTLRLSPSDSSVVELVESLGPAKGNEEPRYARVRERKENETYSAALYDVLTGARLASAGYGGEKGKRRRLQLHGPDEDIPFDFTGKINFEWTFQFEGNKYRWTREVYGKDYICSIDRKPDPRVEICLARDSSKNDPGRIQILHYNIDRFPDEIKDLRGLETLLVASLLCLLDAADDRSSSLSVVKPGKLGPSLSPKEPPPLPPPPPPRVISEEDFEPENPNEIIVRTISNVDDHIARALNLLEEPNILFIVIRTRTAEATQRALEVSLGITRFRHREGLSDLHQYVIEEGIVKPTTTTRPGPKVIKLDDEPPKPDTPQQSSSDKRARAWTPPPNIAIYLSTIKLPDLEPGRRDHLHEVQSTPVSSPRPSLTPQDDSGSKRRSSSFGKLFKH